MGVTPGGRGRFEGFDSIAQSEHWDDETQAVVFTRLATRPPVVFFTNDEEAVARALLDRLLGQDDEPKVPVLELIDARLSQREGDGYRYHDMPDDGDAWKRSVRALDDDAVRRYHQRFSELDTRGQKHLIEQVRTAPDDWHGMPGTRVFQLWMRYATTAFYSHPWAWNEIGFPGPAYPRGYKALGLDRLEPFERRERDPRDPIPWLRKVDAARAEHDEAPSAASRPDPDTAAEAD
jgi:hypothetical protein